MRLELCRPKTAFRWRWAALVLAFTLYDAGGARAQQQADSAFVPHVVHPAFHGPRVLVDEAHHNFHTAVGRYRPFAELLVADGFLVERSARAFEPGTLGQGDILVIANAMGGGGVAAAYEGAAFTEAECDTVAAWVRAGGALFLIADHAPFGTGAEPLARRFGIGMGRGYTEDPVHHDPGRSPSWLVFTRDNGLLRHHPITDGRDASESVAHVVAFTGQSLTPPPGGRVLLALAPEAVDHPAPTAAQAAAASEPGYAWMSAVVGMPTHTARDRAMAIAFRFGSGRVVAVGEAAMFTAQTVVDQGHTTTMGMSAANDNEKLTLNVLHWLAGLLPDG